MSLRRSALVVSLSAGIFGILPAAVLAQDQAIVEVPNAGTTVLGEVNASSVNVRSGPAESYYPTMMLNKGDRVTAVGHRFEWLKIVPPKGSFSYIAKIYVDRDGQGNTGKVNRDDVLVRAGSTLNALKAQPQLKMNKGSAVEIIGEAEEYYKITPPEGAYLYIAKKYVDPTDGKAAEAATPVPASTTQPSVAVQQEQPAQATITQQPAVEEPVVKAPEVKSSDALAEEAEAEFRRLEARFNQMMDQPVEEQPVVELLGGYRELKGNERLSSTARRMADFRVRYLEVAQKQQEELKSAKQAESDFTARQAELDREREAIERRVRETSVAVYTAVGQLQTSSVQRDGQPLLRLVDPADGRTLVYLNVTDAAQRSMVGQFVGVRGEVAQDDRLALKVIEPSELNTVEQAKVMRGVTARIYPPSIVRKAKSEE